MEPKSGKSSSAAARNARQKAALRANLQRRKAQARARDDSDRQVGGDAGGQSPDEPGAQKES